MVEELTRSWPEFEARTPVKALQVESLERCPFPVGYGVDGNWHVELPSGSRPITKGDWIVSIGGSSLQVMSAQAFAALVGAPVDLKAPKKGEVWPAAPKAKTGGIESAGGASTRDPGFGT